MTFLKQMGDSLNGKWCAREEEIQEKERITQLPERISNLKYPRFYVSHVVDPLSSSIQKKKCFTWSYVNLKEIFTFMLFVLTLKNTKIERVL